MNPSAARAAERLPDVIATEEQLDHVLATPREELVDAMRHLSSPLVLLGAGGKMGPSLAVLAARAARVAGHKLDIVAVSRFSDEQTLSSLQGQGVRTLRCDLLDRAAVERLPDSANVVYLAGLKFGTADNPSLTWAVNTLAPAHVAERYRTARIVALSTGNVYPLADVRNGGATEADPLTPVGEYANAAVGRERIFDYFSRQHGTAVALLRLSYAVELRYGVLADIARKVAAGEPINVSNGWFNCIWQGDANEMILRAFPLASSPSRAWNLTAPQPLSVREVALRFAELLERPARFIGDECDTALLSNAARVTAELGSPATPLERVIEWVAHWVASGGRTLSKPTHFEVRDGVY